MGFFPYRLGVFSPLNEFKITINLSRNIIIDKVNNMRITNNPNINSYMAFKFSKIEYYLDEFEIINALRLQYVTKRLKLSELICNPIDHRKLLHSGLNTKIKALCYN